MCRSWMQKRGWIFLERKLPCELERGENKRGEDKELVPRLRNGCTRYMQKALHVLDDVSEKFIADRVLLEYQRDGTIKLGLILACMVSTRHLERSNASWILITTSEIQYNIAVYRGTQNV